MVEPMLIAIATVLWIVVVGIVLVIAMLPVAFTAAWIIAAVFWLLGFIVRPLARLLGCPIDP